MLLIFTDFVIKNLFTNYFNTAVVKLIYKLFYYFHKLFLAFFLASLIFLNSAFTVYSRFHRSASSIFSFWTFFCLFRTLFFSATSCRFLFLFSTLSFINFSSSSFKSSVFMVFARSQKTRIVRSDHFGDFFQSTEFFFILVSFKHKLKRAFSV